MTTEIEQTEQQEAEYLATIFTVKLERLAARGQSLGLLLLHRRCASCWGTLIQEPEQGINIDAKQHMRKIVDHCSKTPEFIHPELPVMEAVFRILLSGHNKPMTLESIYQVLRERWWDLTNPRTPPPATLYRMLSHDAFYGISQVSETKQEDSS